MRSHFGIRGGRGGTQFKTNNYRGNYMVMSTAFEFIWTIIQSTQAFNKNNPAPRSERRPPPYHRLFVHNVVHEGMFVYVKVCNHISGPAGGGRQFKTNNYCNNYVIVSTTLSHECDSNICRIPANAINVFLIFQPDAGKKHFRVRFYRTPLKVSTEALAAHARPPTIACTRASRIAPKPYVWRSPRDN